MRKLVAAVSLAIALATLTAGCGAEDVDPAALAEAADATKAQEGVHLTMKGTVEANGQTITIESEGDADLNNTRVALKSTTSNEQIPEMEQVMIGTTMYMRMEGLMDEVDADWIKIDLAKAGEQAGIDFEQLMQTGGGSPADQLAYLRAVSDLEKVGEEEIDGVNTTHYKGVVDLRRYPETVPPAERERARRSMEKIIELGGGDTTPIEVWIDDDDLVRREKFTTKQSKPVEMEMEVDMRFSDFGKTVRISAPQGDVKDMTDVAAEGLNGGG